MNKKVIFIISVLIIEMLMPIVSYAIEDNTKNDYLDKENISEDIDLIEKEPFDDLKIEGLNIVYMSHIKNKNWQEPVVNKKILGTTGQNKKLVHIYIHMHNQ